MALPTDVPTVTFIAKQSLHNNSHFIISHGSCGSQIWTEHSNSLSLLQKAEAWNHLETFLLMYLAVDAVCQLDLSWAVASLCGFFAGAHCLERVFPF